MTDVSQFELVYKPQSPVGPADVVLQGYFLNITNLEEVELFFRLDFVTSSVPDADRTLAGNTTAIVDTPTQNNLPAQLNGSAAASSFRLIPNVVIPPGGTAKVVVLPSDPFAMPGGTPDFEARGYVTIRLPGRLTFTAPGFIGFERQIEGAARILVTPQNRATYFDTDGAVSDQTQSSVPTGSGSAVLEVAAELFPFVFFERLNVPLARETLDLSRLEDLQLEEFAALMATIAASETDMKALNAALAEAGVGMTLARKG